METDLDEINRLLKQLQPNLDQTSIRELLQILRRVQEQTGDLSQQAERRKVKTYAEQHADVIRKMGGSVSRFCESFDHLLKRDPRAKASALIGPG